MKKGIARPGLIALLALFTSPGYAYSVSDLLISEVMANPVALADSAGEWFELYNPTDELINLRDTWLGDDGADLHRFDTDLLIMPAQYLTLARSLGPGFIPDYVYDDFTLANGTDEIVFSDLYGELLRLDYRAGFVLPGQSMELMSQSMQASHYAPVPLTYTYGGGDAGTPGSASSFRFDATPVPAPPAAWLIAAGMVVFAFARSARAALRRPAWKISPGSGRPFDGAQSPAVAREAC